MLWLYSLISVITNALIFPLEFNATVTHISSDDNSTMAWSYSVKNNATFANYLTTPAYMTETTNYTRNRESVVFQHDSSGDLLCIWYETDYPSLKTIIPDVELFTYNDTDYLWGKWVTQWVRTGEIYYTDVDGMPVRWYNGLQDLWIYDNVTSVDSWPSDTFLVTIPCIYGG